MRAAEANLAKGPMKALRQIQAEFHAGNIVKCRQQKQGCNACADPDVVGHLPGECPAQTP